MRTSITKALLGGVGATIITVCMTVSSWSMTNPEDPAAEAIPAVPVELRTKCFQSAALKRGVAL